MMHQVLFKPTVGFPLYLLTTHSCILYIIYSFIYFVFHTILLNIFITRLATPPLPPPHLQEHKGGNFFESLQS